MGFFSRLLNRQGGVRYVFVANNDPVAVDLDLAAIYKTQPNLQAVISFIADNIAQLSIKVYNRRDTNDRERVTDSPAARLLGGPVNPDMTAYEYVRALVSNYLLYGRHYDLIINDENAPSGYQIRPLPVTWITDYKNGNAFNPGTLEVSFPEGGSIDLTPDDYVLYKSYNPASATSSLSPVAALRNVLAEQIEAERYRSQVWKRGGRVSSVIKRPKDVEAFTPDQREKFMTSLKDAWTGDFASNAGGLMLLEDGMEIQPYQVNAHEAQWAEAKKLSREDVAAIYHINPKIIWPGDGQTYASAKDNARALYSDAFAPILKQIESRWNAFLLPRLGEPEGNYCEFDISGKLRGNFEEQAQVLYQAVGGPYMMPNEARGIMNLPSLGEEFNSIYVPLNMTQVGADGEPEQLAAEQAAVKAVHICSHCEPAEDALKLLKDEPVKFKATAEEEDAQELAEIFRKFYERQAKSVLPKIGAKAEWWDSERWNRELADDLFETSHRINLTTARAALEALGYDLPYTAEEAAGFIRAMCEDRAIAINEVTLERLLEALQDEDGEGQLSTPQGVFENAIEERSESNGTSLATALVSFSAIDAARVIGRETGDQITKTWIHNPSANPRPSHAAMNGETVGIDDRFSNGMDWPGDIRTGTVDEIASCHCEVEITRP